MKQKLVLCGIVGMAIVLMLNLVVSCKSAVEDKPVITVSIQPQKFFLEKIVGDRMTVECLLANGGNPESFEPTLAHLLSLEKSMAYFKIGNMGFESAVIDKVRGNNPGLKIYDNSSGVELLTGTHGECCGHHHHHGHSHDIDPHTWSSVKNARIIAGNMYCAVVELDSLNKEFYTENYGRFVAELDSIDGVITGLLHDKRGAAFVVWHPSLSYFARDYGLEQISIGSEGKEASARQMQAQLDDAREHDARVFFFQKDYDSRQASVVCEQTGIGVTPINPLSYEWDKEILMIANAIASK